MVARIALDICWANSLGRSTFSGFVESFRNLFSPQVALAARQMAWANSDFAGAWLGSVSKLFMSSTGIWDEYPSRIFRASGHNLKDSVGGIGSAAQSRGGTAWRSKGPSYRYRWIAMSLSDKSPVWRIAKRPGCLGRWCCGLWMEMLLPETLTRGSYRPHSIDPYSSRRAYWERGHFPRKWGWRGDFGRQGSGQGVRSPPGLVFFPCMC